jgi:hypothetical protein
MTTPLQDTPFVNEFRLNARHWAVAFVIIALVLMLAPRVWTKLERFERGPDYRIPYALSKDYWLYARRLQQLADTNQIIVLGDSVIWGEYVRADGTLSHFLGGRFINAGVNGLFPLAEEGLIEHYGAALRGRKILLHCNLLWLTSPKADLQAAQDDINHARLLPQFFPRIPAYTADASERLSAAIECRVPFLAWANHLQDVYFSNRTALPADDAKRGPGSRRHRSWTETSDGPVQFDWVPLKHSLQWRAFQRLVLRLRERGNDVCVVLGPFNEHMLAEESRSAYRALRAGIAGWLAEQRVCHVVPEVLPSPLYADASHPLTAGYQRLAQQLCQDATVATWLKN